MISLKSAKLESFLPLPEKGDQYSVEFIESKGAIKLREEDDRVLVGVSDAADAGLASSIRKFHRKPVEFLRIEKIELAAYLGKRMSEDGQSVKGDGEADAGSDERVLLDKLANDAPIVNLVNSICIDAIRAGASDIHIEAGPETARVRYRIDGVLKTVRRIERERFPAVASRVKIMANLNILERRQPQDGRITVDFGGDHIDLRISVVPVTGGESIVMRILGRKSNLVSLEELGFASDQLTILRKLFKIPHGLILVTGPTGSGKTTTLNAIIREIVSDELKVVTIEDPVEFVIDGVNQIQTNEQIALGFDTILRRVLRQDPNVIMVGEIRDGITAELAVRAALTGHLVLSTLHTNDAVSVIPRLINMGVERYMIASVLRGAIAQRLVRRTCPDCGKTRPLNEREKRIFDSFGVKASATAEKTGCDTCGLTGFKGRTVIAEVFGSDYALEEAILRGDRETDIIKMLAAKGMRTLPEDSLRKAAEGLTTIAEIQREISLYEGEA